MPPDPDASLRLQEFLQQKDFLPRTMTPVHRVTTRVRENDDEDMDMNQAMSTAELAIAPGVREVASEDGTVLLDVEQGICFSLNPVGLLETPFEQFRKQKSLAWKPSPWVIEMPSQSVSMRGKARAAIPAQVSSHY